MKSPFLIRTAVGLFMTLLFFEAAHAGPIRIAFRDTTVTGGTQFDYPVYVDSSVTGLNVSAYQLEFTYNTSVFTFVSVRSESTMTSGWGAPTYNMLSSGKIRIAGAGADTLIGTGKLVILRFSAAVYQYSTGGNFTFQSILLNQGTPAAVQRNGYVSVTPPPTITVSPDTWLMTKGETKQFQISGGTSPYTWSSTNPSAASINAAGLLTALAAGTTRIVCVDSAGYTDTSGIVEIRAVKLSLRDTSRYQGQVLNLPVYCTDVSGLGITSGQFSVNFNNNLWTPDSFITAGTMLAGWSIAPISVGPNKINVSFASSSSLTGSGILLYIRMKASPTTYGSSSFSFTNPFFNESIPANSSSGTITVTQLAPITVTPFGTQTMVAGDSLQFLAGGGTPPYAWTVSDTSRASISSAGWLKAKKSGPVTASAKDVLGSTGMSGTINIYDFRLSVPDTSLIPASVVDIPLFISKNAIGFSSMQLKVTYSTGSYVTLTDVVSAGTLTAGWSIDKTLSPGTVMIAGAGVNSISTGGTLVKLRFVVPDSTPRPSTINITLSNVVFNQGVPLPLVDNGYFTIANNAIFSVTPASATIQTSAVNKKDSARFTVKNSGTAVLTSSLFISGTAEFTLSTSNISVPPADSTTITLTYLPVNAGNDTATINFSTNDPYHASVAVPIIGKVLQFPILSLNTATINFGEVVVNQFKDTTVTVTNTGSDTLFVSSVTSNNGVFTARPTVFKIPPGNSFADTLRFLPTAVTAYQARFLVSNNGASSPDTIYVNGIGKSTLGTADHSHQPFTFRLEQNYPNPFNPTTVIKYQLASSGHVSLKIYDMLGKEVATLVNGMQDAGAKIAQFDASQLPSGIYFYTLQTNTFSATKKMLLVK